jgi:hypothetical protein
MASRLAHAAGEALPALLAQVALNPQQTAKKQKDRNV